MRRTIAAILGVLAVAAATSALAQPQTLKVAVAQRGFWNSSFVEFALQQGFFKQEGLEIEILYTEGGASTLLPVVSGSLDIAMTNGTLGVIAAFAKGMPVKIISAEATGAPDAFWYARPESGIKSIKDTAGKTVAFSSPGSSTNLIILQLVNQEKATPKLVADRRRAGDADAGDERPDRRRLVGAAVRAAASRRRPPADHRARLRRRGDPQPDHPRQRRQRQCAQGRSATRSCATCARSHARSTGPIPGDAAIDAYAAYAKVPRALAQRTRDEFYPKESLQLAEVRGLDLTLKQAVEFKYMTSPLTAADVQQRLIDILYKPGK